MRNLFLGLQGLDAGDSKLLQVFLRFAGKTERHQWALATAGHADLVLRPALVEDETLPMGLDPLVAAPVVWVLPAGERARADGRMILQRPLQIEPFAALLRAREAEMEAFDASHAAPALAPAAVSVPPGGAGPRGAMPEADAVAPPGATPPAAPVATAAARAAVAEGAAATVAAVADRHGAARPAARPAIGLPAARVGVVNEASVSYRLLKWPAADLLRGQPKFVRMLGFLTHKPMSVERLMLLSGVDEASCLDMLRQLDERRLLSRSGAAAPAAPSAPASATKTAAAAPRATGTVPAAAPVPATPAARPAAAALASNPPEAANGGLFQRLRKRLGLL